MKKLYVITIAVLLATLAISACRKKENGTGIIKTQPTTTNPTNTYTGFAEINSLIGSLKPAAQTFGVTAGIRQTIVTVKGSRLIFYPNSFKDAAGNIITSGTIDISVIEMSTAGEMIGSGALPVTTTGQLLISGGEMQITAKKDGQEVFANKYGVCFKQAAATTQPMNLYLGTTAADSTTSWTLGGSTTGMYTSGTSALASDSTIVSIDTTTVFDTTTSTYTYVYTPTYTYDYSFFHVFDSCTDFGMINCDYFSGVSGLTNVNISITNDSASYYDTKAYVVIPSINSAMRAFNTSAGCRASNIPAGTIVDVVVVSYHSGRYYYARQSGITVTAGAIQYVNLTEHTRDYVVAALTAL